MLVGRQGYWTSRITTVPLSEPVMMRVSSKHSRVQRVITGVCRMARSFCADGRTQGRRSAGAGGMGRYLLLTTYLLLAHLRGGTPPQLEPRHSTLCSFTMASTVALAAGQPRCAQAAVLGACSHEYG